MVYVAMPIDPAHEYGQMDIRIADVGLICISPTGPGVLIVFDSPTHISG